MRRAFTLVELLVVIGIMALLGTSAVGGYRQMQRGMEERSVMQNVNQFIRAAYQRAQIDRQPVAVYFWNETLRAATEDENEVVVGKAVAVRRHGRITKNEGNSYLIDEFADLNLTFPSASTTDDEYEETSSSSESKGKVATMRLYRLNNVNEQMEYSIVRDQVEAHEVTEIYLDQDPVTATVKDDVGAGKMKLYAFVVEQANGGASGGNIWKNGDAYGMEFATIELPRGYIFESSYSKDMNNPVTEIGSIRFKPSAPGQTSGGTVGKSTITVYSLRPGQGGSLSPQKVDTSDSPTVKFSN